MVSCYRCTESCIYFHADGLTQVRELVEVEASETSRDFHRFENECDAVRHGNTCGISYLLHFIVYLLKRVNIFTNLLPAMQRKLCQLSTGSGTLT